MKKFFLTALIAMSLVSSSFASETNVNYKIKTNFGYDFKNVTDVGWSVGATYASATFLLDSKRTNAYYDFDGNLIGTTQAVTLDVLPAKTKRAFAKRYADYVVKEAIVFEKQDETAYFVSAQRDKESIVLKITEGQIAVFKKG